MSRIENFKTHKDAYLHGHTIMVGHENDYDNEPGVAYFDLVPVHNMPKRYTLTQRVNPTKKVQGDLICAAWLPYWDKNAMAIDLSADAYKDVKYFFTAELSGCRLEIGCADRPKVVHIAANVAGFDTKSWDQMSPSATALADGRLDQAANEAFGQLPHRKYSKRSGYPKAPGGTVVGFLKGHRWEFYAQERNWDSGTQVTTMNVRHIITTEP